MYIAILGRQPEIAIAELEAVFGSENVDWFGDYAALVTSQDFPLDRLGGTIKAARVITQESGIKSWREVSFAITKHYSSAWANHDGKITLGLSAYGFRESPRDIQQTGIILKQKLKQSGTSLRLIPNPDSALSSASSHHNKLGSSANKVELIVAKNNDEVIVAESIGTQNITAYAQRDQGRPKRDAFVGMLPPKLAQIIVNLAVGRWLVEDGEQTANSHIPSSNSQVLLDPFCGTGVILQEASLMGYDIYGTDVSEKMIRYTRDNLNWLFSNSQLPTPSIQLETADATDHIWRQPIDFVACEGYLGQPLGGQAPSEEKMSQIIESCDQIMRGFLINIHDQLNEGTRLCIAAPAWFVNNQTHHLPVVNDLLELGYTRVNFKYTDSTQLIYRRPDQTTGRELLILEVRL